jgi:hypothetical protein
MKNIYVVFIVMFVCFSCIEENEVKVDNLVVNSFFSPDAEFVVQTSNSVSVFDTATYSPIKDLKGKIFEDDILLGELKFRAKYAIPGFAGEIPQGYSLENIKFTQGKKYRLEFDYKGQKVRAEDVIPKAVPFEISKTEILKPNEQVSESGFECTIDFNDPKDEENFYLICYNSIDFVDENDKLGWAQSTGWMKSEDPSIEYSYYHPGVISAGQRFIFSDKYFDGKKYSMKVVFNTGISDQPNNIGLTVYFISISKKYYQYVVSYLKQEKNNDDFYSEPTQVFNNIENGLGIFAGFSVQKKEFDFRKK